MLTEDTLTIIKASVPFLKNNGLSITKRFYKNMFTHHPELKNMFNMASQANGAQAQSLAQSLFGFSSFIDKPELLQEMIGKIAHKHAGLEVQKEHYPIVGKYLTESIREELGNLDPNGHIVEAWKEAYLVLANILMKNESEIYSKSELQPGGWKGFKNFKILKKVRETEEVTSFYLSPEDGMVLPQFIPGQSISVQISLPDNEYIQIRNYSLSDIYNPNWYRITVKKTRGNTHDTPNGLISNFLHNNTHVGDVLKVHAPIGSFTLNSESNTPLVLISAGIGITPFIAMLKHSVVNSAKREIFFIHCAQNSKQHAFKESLSKLAEETKNVHYFYVYKTPLNEDKKGIDFQYEGDLNLNQIKLPLNGTYYLCGSGNFLNSVIRNLELNGISRNQIKFEGFGPTGDFRIS